MVRHGSGHKLLLKQAKSQHKESQKRKDLFIEKRDALVMAILSQPVPNWGSLIVKLEKT